MQRPDATDAECRDTNAGTFHLLLTNYLGILHQSIVEDRTYNDEVWNQLIVGYSITRQEPLTLAQALAGTGVDRMPDGAVEFWRVEDLLTYSDQSQRLVEFVLALDDPGTVLEGQWAGASREKHPDFIWTPTAASRAESSIGGLTYSRLRELHDLAGAEDSLTRARTQVLARDISLEEGSLHSKIGVPGSYKLTVQATGAGNAGLYVRLGAPPTVYSYLETDLSNAATQHGGVYYIRVRPTDGGGDTIGLTATITP